VLCLHGPLTVENVQPFQNALRREAAAESVIVDLTEVPYIDSSGLGSLVSAYVSGHKSGRRIALTGVNERVFRLFEVTKTESLFLMFPTIEDAITSLGLFRCRLFGAHGTSRLCPAFLYSLPSPPKGQRITRNIIGDTGSRAYVRPFADADGRNQR